MENNKNFELIYVLVNQGFTGSVMDAARKAGAKGGTIMTCRGGANEQAEKTYGMAITPNKELVMILVDSEIKNTVINAIYEVAGIETNGMAIIWTVPADNVVGMKPEEIKPGEIDPKTGHITKKIK